jgi:hypothetical protein
MPDGTRRVQPAERMGKAAEDAQRAFLTTNALLCPRPAGGGANLFDSYSAAVAALLAAEAGAVAASVAERGELTNVISVS